MITERPPIKSMISKRLWRLMETDPEAFKQQVKEHFALGYPRYVVDKAKYPFIYLREQ
jgi:hypothetical protein